MKHTKIGIVLALVMSMGSVAFAQSVGSATISLSVNGGSGTSYTVGQSWTIGLTSNLPNSSFSICGTTNKGIQSCTPLGTTNASGTWSGGGSFDASTVGSWTEWIFFPSQSVASNQIAFTVSQVSAGSTSSSGGICTTGFPPNPAPAGGFTYLTVQECTPYNTCSILNQDYTSTQDTANILAAALGASVVANANPLGDTHYTFSAPEYELAWPNGTELPAGYVAKLYETGNNPSTDPGFKQLLQSICSSSGMNNTGITGAGTGAGAGTGGNGNTGTGTTTGSGAGTTGTGTSGSGSSLSTINSNLNGALAGFSSALSGAAAQANGGSGSGGASGSAAAGAGGSASVSSCASSAATTVSSALQTLQGLSGVLSSGNTNPGVLTSIQNLINAVAQVLSALSKCV